MGEIRRGSPTFKHFWTAGERDLDYVGSAFDRDAVGGIPITTDEVGQRKTQEGKWNNEAEHPEDHHLMLRLMRMWKGMGRMQR